MSKAPEHYVNNQEFFDALVAYRDVCVVAKQQGQSAPQIPEFIGECFLKIATHLSYKANFVNYTFREDMISDGVENCIVYMHNFDPDKSKNAFGYFTSVIFYAFVRRIQRERKHTYLRYKMIEQAVIHGDTQATHAGGGQYHVDSAMLSFDNVQEFIQRFDDYTDRRRARRRMAKTGELL